MVGTRVYIGNLPYGTNRRDLKHFFRHHGRIRDVTVKHGGYGFVVFDDYRDAEDAIYDLNRETILGERVRVEKARGFPRGRARYSRSGSSSSSGTDREQTCLRSRFGHPIRTDHRVIVENLSSRVSWQHLKDYMRRSGEVTYADAHNKHKNEAVVHFASRRDMKNAIEELNDTILFRRRIKVYEKKSTRREESSSSSGSSSGSSSRPSSYSSSRSRSPLSGSRDRSRSRDDRTHSVSEENGHSSSQTSLEMVLSPERLQRIFPEVETVQGK